MAPKEPASVQVPFVGSRADPDLAFTIMKGQRGRVSLWLETEEGEASVEMTRDQFTNMVGQARQLMGWK